MRCKGRINGKQCIADAGHQGKHTPPPAAAPHPAATQAVQRMDTHFTAYRPDDGKSYTTTHSADAAMAHANGWIAEGKRSSTINIRSSHTSDGSEHMRDGRAWGRLILSWDGQRWHRY